MHEHREFILHCRFKKRYFMLFHRLLGTRSSLRFFWIILLALVICRGSTTWAIDLVMLYDDTQGGAVDPAFDLNGTQLQAITSYVESYYEDIFEDNGHTLTITFWYTDLNDGLLGDHDNISEDGNGREDVANIKIDTQNASAVARNYFYDPTPDDDSEYNMTQTLWRDVVLGGNQFNWYTFGGGMPDTFEAGYTGTATNGGAVGAQDMLSLVLHEVGHALGMSSGIPNVVTETMDLDYDYDSDWVFGAALAADNINQVGDVVGHLNNPNALMFPSLNIPGSASSIGVRKRPSHTDLFAMATGHAYTQLDVPRREFYNPNGDWNTVGNWSGEDTPGSADDTFVRSGRTAILSGDGYAANLRVTEAALVSTQANTLLVQDTVDIVGTPGGSKSQITINTAGMLHAEITNIYNHGIVVIVAANSTLQSEKVNIAAGGLLRGQGTVYLDDLFGLLTSDGLIEATNGGELVITSDNGLGLDLGGEIEAINGDIRFETGMLTEMTADMTVGAGRQVAFNFGGSVGAGGTIQLEGTTASPATVTGGNLFLGFNGTLNANGLGVVENTLLLQTSSAVTTEFGDPNSEVRLNGTTFLDGGSIVGHGIARQNGNVLVTGNSLITIETYDMDGQFGDTVITIDPDRTLDVNSPNIDTTVANDFDGQIIINSGTLDMENDWRLDGSLSLSETTETVPVLKGDGTLTVSTSGQINVSGAGIIESDVILDGGVSVGSEVDFNGSVLVNSTAVLQTNNPSDSIDFNGPTTLSSGSYIGGGVLKFDNQVFVVANTGIGMADTDLDGDTGNAEINIPENVTFSVSSNTLEQAANDGFDGVMNLSGTFSSLVGFRLDGELYSTAVGGNPIPRISGPTSFTIHTTGEVNTNGDLRVDRPMIVQGDLNVGSGTTFANGTASFASTAGVTVAVGSKLELNGTTTFSGGSYTGAGLIQMNALTVVDSATTIFTDRVDLDGSAENTQILINDASLTLNVDTIDEGNNLFGGTISVTGNSAMLAVNLNNPLNAWRLSSTGNMNFSATSLSPVTMLDGSDVTTEGFVTAEGRVRLAANVSVKSNLLTADASTDVHFAGSDRSFIYNTAIASGLGSMTIDNGSTMNLEDATSIGLNVNNDGRLEIGFLPNEVNIDVIEPGAATIQDNFLQTPNGEFAVDLGGLIQGTEFDWLDVTGIARVNGTIELQLIDGYQPMVGDTYQVLTAATVIGTFEEILTIDETNMFDFDITAFYSATDVVLRVDDIYLSADFDHDDDVDGNDFLIWQLGLGLTMEVNNTNGDATGDGLVNDEDLAIWESQYGSIFSPLAAASAVPEPCGCVLFVLGAIGLCRSRRSR
jgi:hypothetical protein